MATLNTAHDQAYEYLSLIIDEFENAAVSSGKREGLLVAMYGPLAGMENILQASDDALTQVNLVRGTVLNRDGPNPGETSEEQEEGEGLSLMSPQIDVVYDEDLFELMGAGEPTLNYIQECLGCNLRLQFDWQLQPLNLLGPINAMVDILNGALNRIGARLDPWNALEEVCTVLNGLQGFCIPDIIMVLMSIKLLLKRYMGNVFAIKLDWTVVLGPLLNVIVQGISGLLNNLMSVMVAPLDCVVAGLRTANQLERESRDFLRTADAFVNESADFIGEVTNGDIFVQGRGDGIDGVQGGLTARDIRWDQETRDRETGAPHPGRAQVRERDHREPHGPGEVRVASGFDISGTDTIADALAHPNFVNATWIEKMLLPVQEATAWIKQLVQNILESLNSLGELVGGGLSLHLDNLGVMLFLTDMISLVTMVIRMLRSNVNVTDWCSFLEENPQVLEQNLRDRFGNVRVESARESRELILRRGPDIVGRIQTCINARSASDQQAILQWINELQARGDTA